MAVQWFKGTVLFGLARLAKLLSSSEWRFRFFVAPSSEVALLGGGIFGDALAFGVHFALALPLGLGLLGDALLGSALLGDALLGDALLGDALLGESWLGFALLGDVFFGEALLFGALRFAALALGLAMAPFGALASLGGVFKSSESAETAALGFGAGVFRSSTEAPPPPLPPRPRPFLPPEVLPLPRPRPQPLPPRPLPRGLDLPDSSSPAL